MYNKKYILGYVCLIILLSISMISAVPPFEENVNTLEGLQIFEQKMEYLPSNEDFELHIHISNISNGFPLSNVGIDCRTHFYNNAGEDIFESEVLSKSADGFEHEILILGGNFSNEGEHAFIVWCNNSVLGGTVKGEFWVTESGIEITEPKSILVIGLMGILFLLLFASLFVVFSVENYMVKFIFYWISHILMVLIFFIGWQVGVEGLLGGMALTGIFRILFWIFILAVLPMIFVSVAWVVYIHAFNEHFQKLIDKGEDPETAFAIANKKRGWMFGN